MQSTFAKIIALFGLLALVGVAFAQQKFNPRTQINWPLLSGPGTPTSQGFTCSAVNYGQPYTDTSTTPNNFYTCGADGWVIRAGGIGSPYSGVTSDGSSGINVTGNVKASTLNASVNGQMNVMAFGAKGDCSTDDHNAIMAAQAAAVAQGIGANLPGVVYFPKPPGGCYLTSTIQFQGVTFVGQPSGNGVNAPHNYNVTIKGKPGQVGVALHVTSGTGDF